MVAGVHLHKRWMSLDIDGRIDLRTRVRAQGAKTRDPAHVRGGGTMGDQQQAKSQDRRGAQPETQEFAVLEPPKAKCFSEGWRGAGGGLKRY
jgi:hypothetical protein